MGVVTAWMNTCYGSVVGATFIIVAELQFSVGWFLARCIYVYCLKRYPMEYVDQQWVYSFV